MRVALSVFAAVIGSMFIATAVQAAGMPMGGVVHIFVQPGKTQGTGTIVVVGAIGDYGKTTGQNKQHIGTVILQKGTFEVNLTAIGKKMNAANPTVFNKSTCSYAFGATAPAPISNGTGAYKGISGTLTITETFAGYGPLYTSGAHKGQCNTSDSATPTAQWGSVTGVGTVKFT